MRRWFQFRLRTAFFAVTLLSLPLGWICGQFHEWQAEALALTDLKPNQVQYEAAIFQVAGTGKLPIFL